MVAKTFWHKREDNKEASALHFLSEARSNLCPHEVHKSGPDHPIGTPTILAADLFVLAVTGRLQHILGVASRLVLQQSWVAQTTAYSHASKTHVNLAWKLVPHHPVRVMRSAGSLHDASAAILQTQGPWEFDWCLAATSAASPTAGAHDRQQATKGNFPQCSSIILMSKGMEDCDAVATCTQSSIIVFRRNVSLPKGRRIRSSPVPQASHICLPLFAHEPSPM